MRHQKSGRALGVKPAHRRAMLRNLVTSVLEHEQITTTMARAKELRGPLDKMITLGKKGDLNARRKALTFVKSKKAMEGLFGEFATRYADRPGGFSRLVRMGMRRGDGAEMALVQLVGAPNDAFAAADKPKAKRGGGRRRGAAKADAASEKEGQTKDEEKADPDKEKLTRAQSEKAAGEKETSQAAAAQTGGEEAPENVAVADQPPAEAGEKPVATEEKAEATQQTKAAAEPPQESKEEEKKKD